MNKILISLTCLVFLIGLSGSVSAQPNVSWAKTYDGGSTDVAYGAAVDSVGNVIVTGGSYNGGDWDYYTIKYDSDGNQIWAKTYDGGASDQAQGVAVDSDDNVIVTGYSAIGGYWAYYTIKYDSDGNQLWAKTYNSGKHDQAHGVAVDSDDNVIVTGESHIGADYDYYTIKYDSDGNQLWNMTYDGGNDDQAHGASVDSVGNVIVTGDSHNGADYDYYTIKYDSDGNQLWAKTYDGGNDDHAYGVASDSAGNVIVAGWSHNGLNGDYYTIKYDSDGNQLWAKTYDNGKNDHARGVAVDSDDNVIVAGRSKDSDGYFDYYTIQYDPDGNQVWAVRYDGGNHDDAYGVAVYLCDVIVVGKSFTGISWDYLTVKYEGDCPTQGEGCTPGFWKNHYEGKNEAWGPTGYSPGDDFDTVFGVDAYTPDETLLSALNLGGGHLNKLARHGVSALLNAAHGDVNYPMSVIEVINAVSNAIISGNYEPLATQLDDYNNLGCLDDD